MQRAEMRRLRRAALGRLHSAGSALLVLHSPKPKPEETLAGTPSTLGLCGRRPSPSQTRQAALAALPITQQPPRAMAWQASDFDWQPEALRAVRLQPDKPTAAQAPSGGSAEGQARASAGGGVPARRAAAASAACRRRRPLTPPGLQGIPPACCWVCHSASACNALQWPTSAVPTRHPFPQGSQPWAQPGGSESSDAGGRKTVRRASAGSGKKGRRSGRTPSVCQVEGCGVNLDSGKPFYRLQRICGAFARLGVTCGGRAGLLAILRRSCCLPPVRPRLFFAPSDNDWLLLVLLATGSLQPVSAHRRQMQQAALSTAAPLPTALPLPPLMLATPCHCALQSGTRGRR